jgi:hypothetical protein
MPPRTLPALAHALATASDMDMALVGLGEALAEVDRSAAVALFRFDGRRQMLTDRAQPRGDRVEHARYELAFDQLPGPIRARIVTAVEFVDFADDSADYARLMLFAPLPDGGLLSLRGISLDGQLVAILALYESRRIFGARAAERFAPSAALFALGFARFSEREGREEATRTLESVMQRVHEEYDRRLAALEGELAEARDTAEREMSGHVDPARVIQLEREAANAAEEARKASRRAEAVEQQVVAAVSQLEQAHIELHRRSEALRQKTRSLYLIDTLLTLDAEADDPQTLAEGVLNLMGDDMQAQRCSLLLMAPEPDTLYIAALRGVAPNISVGSRVPLGSGVAGKVAASRTPLLVQDVADAQAHPLLRDEYFTTGSFISFPLVYRDELLGVMNLTNRARRGVFEEEDVERVRMLALVTSLIVSRSRLPERLIQSLSSGVR